MKVKIIGPEMGRLSLFEKVKKFLTFDKISYGISILEADDTKEELVFFAFILWEEVG